jgi:hypothetical protein
VSPVLQLAAYTIFWIGRQTGGTNRRVLQGSANNQLFGYWGGYKKAIYISGDPNLLTTQASDTEWDLMSHSRVASGPYTFSWNGELIISAPTSTANALYGLSINTGESPGETSDCQFGEIIVYDGALSLSQIHTVEGYLAWKWNIFPTTMHPFYENPPMTRNFNPIDVPGCILWLDGADQSTTGPASSVATGWLDKSGNANNMSAVGTITVQPAGGMYFGGSAYFSRGAAVVTGVHTIFVVFNKGDGNGPLYYTTSGVNGNNGFFPNYAGTMYLAIGPPGYWYTIYNQFPNNTPYMASITYTGSTTGSRVELYQNGSLVVSTTLTGNLPDPFNAFYLGFRTNDLGNAFTGYMYEVVAYSNVLSSSQRQQVEGYLVDKWGPQSVSISRASLPATHSFKTIPPSSLHRFSPTVISGCEVWLDASDPYTTTTLGLGVWQDKSGLGNNFTTTSGTVSVTVDGTNRVISFPSGAIMQSALNASFTTSSAFYIVFRLTALSPTGINSVLAFPSINPSGNVGDYSIRLSGAGLIGTPANPGGVNDLAIANYFVNGFFNPNYPLNAYYVNSYAIVGTTLPSRSGTSKITLSSSFFSRFLTGNIAEVLYYPNGLTTFQRQQVEGYLASKWGLSEKLPTTHPFYKFPPAYASSSLVAGGGELRISGSVSHSIFTSSGSFIVRSGTGVVNYIVVGGGGGGGDRHGGGGGGGGVVSGKFTANAGTYTITVGAGGDGGYYEANNSSPRGSGLRGGDSSISGPNITTITALGGGGGGTYDGNPTGTFGSGGGGGGNGYAGIAGTAGQGNSGGSGLNPGGGGGGGAGGAGVNANTSTGGIGSSNYTARLLAAGYGTFFGVVYGAVSNLVLVNSEAYIAGGGGGAAWNGPGTGGQGGYGGGGQGGWNTDLSAGTPNTGGGGGGCRSANEPSSGFSGGSGFVLLWY